MNKGINIRTVFFLVILGLVPLFAAKLVTFGYLYNGTAQESAFVVPMEQEVKSLLKGEFNAHFPTDKKLVASADPVACQKQLAALLNDPSVTIVIALGSGAIEAVSRTKVLSKPVYAPLVFNPSLQKLPLTTSGSGRENLLYTIAYPDFARTLEMFQAIIPFDTLGLIVPSLDSTLLPPTEMSGVVLKYFAMGETVEQTVASTPQGCKAVALFPSMNMADEKMQMLYTSFAKAGIAPFSFGGAQEANRGALASIAGNDNIIRLTRTTSLNIQRILLGTKPSSISSKFRTSEALTVNVATLKMLKKELPFAIQREADLVGVLPENVEKLTLSQAMKLAVDSNLVYRAKEMEHEAGQRELKRARSTYAPSVTVGGTGTFRDADNGTMVGGSLIQNSFIGDIKIRQLIFSDVNNVQIGIQNQYQLSRDAELALVRKNISLSAASAYLRVLQAETNLQIIKDDYALIKSNLELAKKRQLTGDASMADVYRLESELAYRQQDMMSVKTLVQQSRFDLNVLLRRDLESPFIPMDTTNKIDEEELVATWTATVGSEDALLRFRNYLVTLALDSAPELQQISAMVTAKEKEKKEQFREFIVPVVAAEADLNQLFAGDPDVNGIAPEGFWKVGLNATWDIFDGGRQIIDRKQADYELQKLLLDKQQIEQDLSVKARTSFLSIREAVAGIYNAEVAAKASEKNFDLVSQNYAQGAADIEALLGAQTAYFTAQQRAYNSRYNYRLSELQAQSAINQIETYATKDFTTILDDFKKWESEQAQKTEGTPIQ